MIRNILVILFLLKLINPLMAQMNLEVETGVVFEGYNDVRIPNEQGTLFSFREDFEAQGSVIPFRLRLGYTFSERHNLSVLFAPLSIRYEGNAPRDINFQSTLFNEGERIEGLYKFNSYRLTYRYFFVYNNSWTLGAGVTAKVRDARVSLASGDKSDKKDDLGFVPLLNVFIRYQPGTFGIQLDGDGWAVKQGRAFDMAATARYFLTPVFGIYGGYRVVEGGANVEEVYNFTMLNFMVVGIIINY
jgi:hypothetical protein